MTKNDEPVPAQPQGEREALRAIVEFCDDPNGSEKGESLAVGLSRLLPAARASLSAAAPSAVSAEARDAARYRWLRDKFGDMKLSASERVLSALGLEDDPVASLDAIIDAAMAPPAASPAQQLREATAREGHCKQCRALYPQHHAGCTRPADNKENGNG